MSLREELRTLKLTMIVGSVLLFGPIIMLCGLANSSVVWSIVGFFISGFIFESTLFEIPPFDKINDIIEGR